MNTNNMKRLIMIITVIFTMTVFYNFATASVVGSWDVGGMMKTTVKLKGKSSTTKSYEHMLFVFNPEKTFLINVDPVNIPGTWKQKKKNFNVYFSLSDLQQFCDEIEQGVYVESGLTVDVLPKSITLKGTEKKDGTIKGTLTIKASVYYVDYQKQASMSISYPFTGTQQVNSLSSVMQQDDKYFKESASFADLLKDLIAETILDDIDDDSE